MVDVPNPFSAMSGEIINTIFSGVIYFIAAIVIGGGILGIFIYIKWRKQYDIEVKIKSTRAEDKHSVIFDRAAIIRDRKDGTKYFRLLGQKVELPVPPYNVLQTSSKGDFLELWRKSETEYIYCTSPTISKKYYVRQDGKLYPMADVKQHQVEGDVDYWRVKRKETNKQLFDVESLWMKLLPYVPQILGGVLIIFVLYILFDSLPQTLAALTELTKELTSLKGAELKAGLIPIFTGFSFLWRKNKNAPKSL